LNTFTQNAKETVMTSARTDRPQPIHFQRSNLEEQLVRLRADAPIRAHGRDSLTLIRDPGFDLILVALNATGQLPEHKAPGAISVLVLDGRIAFSTNGERLELGRHDLVTLPAKVLHSVQALEESAILITITAPVTHTDPIGLEGERKTRE
jgi:quercetin dioxygenase-like cupin family protein